MDPALIDCAKNVINNLGYKNIFVSSARKAESVFKSNIIVAINDRCLMVLNSKCTKPVSTYSWLTISFIGREDNKLRFVFNKVKFSFEFDDENLFRAVSNALQHILTPNELKNISFDQFRIPSPVLTPTSAINRIREKTILHKIELTQSSLTALQSILVYKQPVVNLSEIPEISSFLNIFLDSLHFFPAIKSLSFSELGNIDPYEVLLPYTAQLSQLRRIEIIGPKTQYFEKFILSLSQQSEMKLYTISFSKTNLDNNNLEILNHMIRKCDIKCIEFHDAINRNSFAYFYSSFLSPEVVDNLTMLNLDGTRNIDLLHLVQKLSNIIGLSLSNCSVEVSEALAQLSKLSKLRILNLSHNFCRKVITSMPPAITSLFVDSVNWCNQSLSSFLTNLPQHRLKLSISNIIAQPSEISFLFESLSSAKTAFLTELIWDGNKLSSSFFDFLAMNKLLTSISLSRCFKENKEDSVNLLRKYLERVHTVKKLVLRGHDENVLGRSIEIIVKAILQSPQIEYLDITYNKSDDFGINQLRRLLTPQSHLKQLVSDGAKPSSSTMISDLIRDASALNNIKVSFPHNDMVRLVKKGVITQVDFDQLRSLLYQDDNSQTVFRKFYLDDFPLYLTNNDLAQLKKNVEILTMPNPTRPKNKKKINNPGRIPPKIFPKIQEPVLTPTFRSPKIFSSSSDDNIPLKKTASFESVDSDLESPRERYSPIPRQNSGGKRNSQKDIPFISSEPASYNTDSQSDEIFLPPVVDAPPEAKTVIRRQIKKKGISTVRKVVKRKPKQLRSQSAIGMRKEVKQDSPKQPNSPNRHQYEDDYSDEDYNFRKRPIRRSGSVASPRSPRNFEIPEPPESTRSYKSPKGSKRRVVRRNRNKEADINLKKDDAKPIIRRKRVARNGDQDDENENYNPEITYQQPDWKMPFNLTFVIETEKTRKIKAKYSTESLIREIFKKTEDLESKPPRSRRQRRRV